jgi:hypothetical protein
LDQQEDKRPILLIDALNLFTRHFAANPTVSTLGQQMGGTVGFLNATKNMVELCRPKKVIVVWEGGGSFRRRQLFPEYKANRKPVKLNRFYEQDIPETTENRDTQVKALVCVHEKLFALYTVNIHGYVYVYVYMYRYIYTHMHRDQHWRRPACLEVWKKWDPSIVYAYIYTHIHTCT